MVWRIPCKGVNVKARIALILLLASALLLAQGERGTLNGTVTDPTGAVVPGATVKVLNVATGVETTVQTTTAGVYRVPYLPPGTYKITVTAAGFKTAVRENVILGVAQTLTVDFTLEVGAVTDQITVSAEPPLLETGTAEIGYYVTKNEFDTWPITVGDGRRQIQQFIFTALPGTVGGTWEGSISGGQLFSHEILIDGISLGRMDITGGSNNEFSPSAEAISEFKLQTGMVSAQYTGGQTAVANFATKSGTNELHGSAYYYVQNDALRANSWSNNAAGIKRTPYKQHNFGYSVGGPIWLGRLYDGRNKTFFFHNFEYTRVRNFTSTSFSTLPTKDFKEGNFARLFDPNFTGNANSGKVIGTDALGRPVVFGAIYDPTTSRQVGNTWVRDPFPGNVVPKTRWSPVSQKILELAPITDPIFDTMLNNIPNLAACCPVFGEKMLTIRGDHNFSASHRLAVTFNRNFRARNNSPGGRWGKPPGTPTGVYQWQETPGTLGRVAYNWTISPTVLNHLAAGYNRFGNKNQSVFVDQGWPQKIGLQNVPGTHFPALWFTAGAVYQGRGIGAGGRLGSHLAGGSYNGSTIYQDDLTIIRGKHNFKLGIEQRRYYYNTRPRGGESGQFYFSPAQTALPGFTTQTGHSFASFLLGAVSSSSRAVVTTYFGHRWRSTGWYFMDDWKITRKLTLNLGLRWETVGGLFEVARRQANFSFDRPNPRAGNRPGALVWVDELNRKSFQDRYWWLMSPKFGLAYAISNKLVFRAGYGINSTAPLSYDWGFAGGYGFNGTISVSSATVPLRFAEEPVMWLHDRYPDFRGTLPNKDPSIANGTGVNYFARDSNRLAYVQNWSLGFQYQLPQSFVLEINYIGNKGTRLEAEGLDELNAVPVSVLAMGQTLTDPWTPASGVPQPYPGFTGTVLQALRPFPQYTGIGQQFANFGTSLYNSLQMQLTRHFRQGLGVLAAYTWSKWISLSPSALDGITPADVFNRRLERSINSYGYPHYFKLTWIYEIPVGKGRRWDLGKVANQVLGGWTLTANHQIRSGSPLSISVGGLVSNPLGAARPDLVPGEKIIINHDAPINFRGVQGGVAYLNRNAFALPPVHPGGRNVIQRLGTLGPVLPNIRGPHYTGEDIGIEKTWKIDESKSFELRGVFLNPFNRHGRGNPVTDLSSPFFGQITGPQVGPRNIELSARITF
jgi:hypothetical protein